MIVGTIGSIDDLIEKNEKIIAACEVFSKKTFEKFTTKANGLIPFEKLLARCTTGLNPRKNFVLGHGDCFYVTIKNMDGRNIILDDRCDKIDHEAVSKISARSHLSKGDVLFSGIGTIGRTYLCYEKPSNWNISESVFCFSPNDKISFEYLYELASSDDFVSFAIANSSGAAQKGIRMSDLKSHLVPVLEESDMKAFTQIVAPILQKANVCRKENNILSREKKVLLYKYFGSN